MPKLETIILAKGRLSITEVALQTLGRFAGADVQGRQIVSTRV